MIKKISFSEFNIIGGQILSRVEAKYELEKYDTMRVLVPKAIYNGMINKEYLGKIDVKSGIDEKKITKAGDIIMKLTTPYEACLVTKEDEGLLVPSFCAIINNFSKGVMKEYVLAYLNSDVCQTQLKALITGASNTLVLSVGHIKKIMLPIPELSIQSEISSIYMNEIEKINLLEKIIKLEKEYLDSKFHEMEMN